MESSAMTPPPRRILVRGVNWLGDAVMTTPAHQRLREHLPQAHITLLIHEKLSGLWLHHPSIDALDMWLARIRRRIGYVRPWRNPLLTHAVPPRPGLARMQKLSTTEINRLIH